MNPETALALAKSYVKQTLDGAGALKGKDGVDGQNGADGNGIASIERTNGNGSSGSTDTYTITMTNGETYDFNVYNGADGKDGKDGQSGSGGSSNVYSTEETVVGTWIDGKPIYRVTLPFAETVPANATYTTSVSIPANLERAIRIGGTVLLDSIPYVQREINDGNFQVWCNTNLNKFQIITGWSNVTCPFSGYLVCEYTKTTDTATIDIPSAAAMMAAYEEGVQNA